MEYKKLPAKARINIFLNSFITSTIIVIIYALIAHILLRFQLLSEKLKGPLKILSIIIIGLCILDIILDPIIGYKRHRYKISDLSVEKITGILGMKHEIVPISKMQQIEINEGIINRLLGLSSVKIITSGGEMELEYLSKVEANEISDKLKTIIMEYSREEMEDSYGVS